MVRTPSLQVGYGGSIPQRGTNISVAQLAELRPPKPKVVGSSPTRDAFTFQQIMVGWQRGRMHGIANPVRKTRQFESDTHLQMRDW